jgi:hypothetical protein
MIRQFPPSIGTIQTYQMQRPDFNNYVADIKEALNNNQIDEVVELVRGQSGDDEDL